MTERQAYQYSLFLPIIIPLMLVGLWLLGIRSLPKGLEAIEIYLFFIVMAGFFGGIPYLILCLGILWCTRRRSTSALKKIIFSAPFLLIPLGYVFQKILLIIETENTAIADRFSFWWLMLDFDVLQNAAIFSLIFGYGYIILVFPVIMLLNQLGYFTDSTQHPLHRSVAGQAIC